MYVLLLFIHCLLLLPFIVRVMCWVFVVVVFAVLYDLSSFAIISPGKKEQVSLLLFRSEC